ncbi:MAG: NAD(P)-dependent oxidoreductase [Candidatus Bathyarchaeota archaeon]|nr:NAD(P)-dependent oxidoreductase [Candidatus Bathyarchaeota archaeon]
MILVTGGAGRLGYEVVKLLLIQGEEVRVFDLPAVNWSYLEALKGVNLFKGDITDPEQASRACEGIDALIHLAAIMPPKSEASEKLTLKVNVEGSRNLLRTLNRSSSVVFASSISVYGITADEKQRIGEQHPLNPHDNYSRSKILGEAMVAESMNPYTILRIAPITIADLVELPPIIPYNGQQRVEFIFVEDAAHAIVAALNVANDKETFNVAGGESWQMLGHEYVDRFYTALGGEVDPKYSDEFTAVDWYNTRKSRRLGYQRTPFNQLEEKLKELGEEYGLR